MHKCAVFLFVLTFVSLARGQAFNTPVRASWTDDSSTTAVIRWDRTASGRGTVRYGLTTNFTHTAHDGGGVHRHAIALRDLQPGTRYHYEASSSDGYTQTGTFRTAPAAGQPLHFVFHGDLQGGIVEEAAQWVSDSIISEDPPFIISLGDMGEEAFSDTGFDTWEIFFRICSNELARTIFMPTMGNHDAAPDADYARAIYQRLFELPEPALGNGYYAFTVGSIRFISLNTEINAADQTDWLSRELQSAVNDTNITWVIATSHRPPYSWGERPGDDHYKEYWAPILTRYEADWFISGHSHNYQRTVPIRGVRYLVAGGGGGRLYWSEVGEPAHAFATTCYHHVSCHITNDVMQLRAIRNDGLLFDSTVITNRRQVRVEPAFPLRGQTAKIFYRATEGPLAAANPVHIHLGKDEFSSAFADEPMTWNAAIQRWEYEFTVPDNATQRLAFVFHDGAGTWHNNYTNNWQALLDRASISPAPPIAGNQATIRYEADMGPPGTISDVSAWISYNNGSFPSTGAVAMANVSGPRWECAVPLPDYAESMSLFFSGTGLWDDLFKRRWSFLIEGATNRAWPPVPFAATGSPVITDNPSGEFPDNIGDNVDLTLQGPPLQVLDAPRGFGNFGSIWVNTDETNLYLGGYGADLGGSNNVFLIFLGLDTLSDNAWNLWHKSGLPNALDYLHNLRFTEPMDIAFILGDTYGDGPSYTNFSVGGTGGYDFGQGIYYIGTNSATFVPMSSARLSQFHGTGTVPCATQGTSSQRRTMRWEAALPWSALNAGGPQAVSNLFIGGIIASSSIQVNDRYLSRTILGERAWGLRDGYHQFAYYTVTLRPQRVNLLNADLRGDGIPNSWRIEYFGTPDGPPAEEDSDEDGSDNSAEEIAGTHPLDPASFFQVEILPPTAGEPRILRWPFAANRLYDIYFATNLLRLPLEPLHIGIATNTFSPENDGFYQLKVHK